LIAFVAALAITLHHSKPESLPEAKVIASAATKAIKVR
jgi:hypothetical protein